jgi:hypothetical protein
MRQVNWKQGAELVGLLAVVLSLAFVGFQLRQAREIAISSNDGTYMAGKIGLYGLINDHADIWVRGNSGQRLAEPDATIYRNLLNAFNESTFVDNLQQARLGEASTAEVVMHDFAAFLHQNPGARREWLAGEDRAIAYRRRLVPDGNLVSYWREAIVADLTKLDRSMAEAAPRSR